MAKFSAPTEEIVLSHLVVSRNVERSRRSTPGARRRNRDRGRALDRRLANGWIIIHVGGGPTGDKPTVTLEAPSDQDRVSDFLNVRVADVHAMYEAWSGRGAEF
jgi:hypothetical protein